MIAPLLLVAALWVRPRRRAVTLARLGPVRSDRRPAPPAGQVASVLSTSCGLATGLLAAVVVGGGAGVLAGLVLGAAALFGVRGWVGVPPSSPTPPLHLAGAWDLLAACLRAGLPVATATRCVADRLPGADGDVLRTVARLLAVGADPVQAWEPALTVAATAPLARAARRTARSGAALAAATDALAAELRSEAAADAEEHAQRAGVLITGPLGLCFLPAFFCLGVLPVVIGLAGQLTSHW